MAIWQGRSLRKRSGGKIRPHRKKRKFEIGSDPVYTHIGERRIRIFRVRGGNTKVKLYRESFINVFDKEQKKCLKVKVLDVLENPANPHFVRRDIITKGCVVQTEVGKVLVTSRPGQHGVLNGVLLERVDTKQSENA